MDLLSYSFRFNPYYLLVQVLLQEGPADLISLLKEDEMMPQKYMCVSSIHFLYAEVCLRDYNANIAIRQLLQSSDGVAEFSFEPQRVLKEKENLKHWKNRLGLSLF